MKLQICVYVTILKFSDVNIFHILILNTTHTANTSDIYAFVSRTNVLYSELYRTYVPLSSVKNTNHLV